MHSPCVVARLTVVSHLARIAKTNLRVATVRMHSFASDLLRLVQIFVFSVNANDVAEDADRKFMGVLAGVVLASTSILRLRATRFTTTIMAPIEWNLHGLRL